jgi:hypothetical protein
MSSFIADGSLIACSTLAYDTCPFDYNSELKYSAVLTWQQFAGHNTKSKDARACALKEVHIVTVILEISLKESRYCRNACTGHHHNNAHVNMSVTLSGYKRKVDTPDELLARILDAAVSLRNLEDQHRRTTRDLCTRVAKCSEVTVGFSNIHCEL